MKSLARLARQSPGVIGRFTILNAAVVSLALAGTACSSASPQSAETGVQGALPVDPPAAGAPSVRSPGERSGDVNAIPPGKPTDMVYFKGGVDGPYVAMTFDDGPHRTNTPRLLDMLRKRNIRATFYVVGENAKAYPGIMKRIAAEGHEIGNHTYTHPNLTKLSDASVRRELTRTRDAIIATTGSAPQTMRPPFGALSKRQRAWIFKEFGYPAVMWTVDPLDWKRPGPSVVASRILSRTKSGSIILAHDLHKQTVDAMPKTLDGLANRGFKFVTMSQLFTLEERKKARVAAELAEKKRMELREAAEAAAEKAREEDGAALPRTVETPPEKPAGPEGRD